MAEGYSIDFGRFAIGLYKHFTGYGKSVIKDGTFRQNIIKKVYRYE